MAISLLLVAPRKVLISGTSEVRRGSEANLHCAASPSNPAVTLEWTIDGIPVEAEPRTALVTQMDKGYIASSNLTIQTDPSSVSTLAHRLGPGFKVHQSSLVVITVLSCFFIR